MEAPEKVYLHPDIGGREFIRPWLRNRANQESVEYVRTDVFIEKALRWMRSQGGVDDALSREMIEDFKKTMQL